MIERCDADPRVEGILVDYRHFYGGFDTVARNRKWYRREVRAMRLGRDVDVHSFRDAQGFRVGSDPSSHSRGIQWRDHAPLRLGAPGMGAGGQADD